MTTVARVTGPADLAAALPELLGFTPTESLVVLSLHEPRGRLGLTMRFDLWASDAFVEEVPARLTRDGATRAALLVLTDEPGELPRAPLVAELGAALDRVGIVVTEALLVRDGTWWSYVCTGPCCPATGSPLAPADSGTAGLMAAERVWQGGRLYGSREELEASIAPVLPLGEQVRLAELDVAAEDLLEQVLADRPGAERAEVQRLRGVLARPEAMDAPTAAGCAVALRLIGVRDEVLSWVPRDAARVRALAVALCRWTPRSEASPVLTVLGAAAYAQGGGALARIALEGALAADPDARMAELLLEGLDRQVPPEQVRRSLTPPRRRGRARR